MLLFFCISINAINVFASPPGDIKLQGEEELNITMGGLESVNRHSYEINGVIFLVDIFEFHSIGEVDEIIEDYRLELDNHKMNFNEVDKKYSREVKNGFGIGHGPFIQDVINRLNNGNISAPISIREGMKSLRLAHAIYKSAETRTWINIQDKNQSKLFGIGNNN